MVREQGGPVRVAELQADMSARAMITLLVEVLDQATKPITHRPEYLPLAAITLRAYAELLDTADSMMRDPEVQRFLDTLREELAEMFEREGKRS
jgi:hypothetical protein